MTGLDHDLPVAEASSARLAGRLLRVSRGSSPLHPEHGLATPPSGPADDAYLVARPVRRPRRAVVVLAAEDRRGERSAQRLLGALDKLGIQAIYIGSEPSASQIVSHVVSERADSVEVCLGGRGGVLLLRGLLRELIEVGRRDVSIVVHRID